jgi:hypothetical protein
MSSALWVKSRLAPSSQMQWFVASVFVVDDFNRFNQEQNYGNHLNVSIRIDGKLHGE